MPPIYALPAVAVKEVKEAPAKSRWLFWAAPAFAIAAAAGIYVIASPAVIVPGIAPQKLFALGLILFIAGFVSGLAGFAFSAIGATILMVLQPALAVPLLQGLSTVNQLASLSQLRQEMPKTFKDWWPQGPLPAILGGLIAVPLGVWLLNHLPGRTLTLMIGTIISVYSLFSLFKPAKLILRGCDGAASGFIVGAFGGAIGGFTAFPGVSVVIWTALRNTSKAVTRAIVQPYIVALQILALLANGYAHPSTFGPRYWMLFAMMLPVVLPGTFTGVATYRSMSDRDFKRLTLLLLVLTGGGLVFRAAF